MTALVTMEQMVIGLASRIENGVDANYEGDNQRLKQAMVNKNFFTGTTSDYRLKTNVTALSNSIQRVKQLEPCEYNWKAHPNTTPVEGFIAHQVAQVVPSAVTGQYNAVAEDGSPVYQTLDHGRLVPVLTAAVKELIARVEQLEAQLAATKCNCGSDGCTGCN